MTDLAADLAFRAHWCRKYRTTQGPIGYKLADLAVKHGVPLSRVRREWRDHQGGTAPAG